MLFVVAAIAALVAIIHKIRVPRGVNSATLGRMSEQWLAEDRASHRL